MRAFSRSWTLFKSTWAVLQADKEMAWYPILAILSTLVASAVILGGILLVLVVNPGLAEAIPTEDETAEGSHLLTQIIAFVLLFLYYLVMYFIANYFMVGLAGAALIRFRGNDPTFRDGMQVARQRLGSILGYSVVAATVGVLLSTLRREGQNGGSSGGAIVAALGGTAWNIATFLVIPIITH